MDDLGVPPFKETPISTGEFTGFFLHKQLAVSEFPRRWWWRFRWSSPPSLGNSVVSLVDQTHRPTRLCAWKGAEQDANGNRCCLGLCGFSGGVGDKCVRFQEMKTHIYNSTKQLGDHDKFIHRSRSDYIGCSLTAANRWLSLEETPTPRISSQRSCLSSAMPQRKVMLPKSGSHLGFQNGKPMMEALKNWSFTRFLIRKK